MNDCTPRMQANRHHDRSGSPQRGSIRIKSEAPLDTQILSASSHDLDHQRRMRALQGLPPDPPSIGDILNNFQPPEKSIARPVKAEPAEELNINPATLAMLAKISPKVGPASQHKKNTQDQAVVDLTGIDDRPDNPTYQSSTAQHEVTNGFSQNTTPRQSARASSNQSAAKPQPHSIKRTTLTRDQLNAIDLLPIPQDRLQEVQDTYRQFDQVLPSHVTTWAALKIFAAQHPIPLLDPDNIRHAQTQWYHTIRTPSTPSLRPTHTTQSPRLATVNNTCQANRPILQLPQLKEEEPDSLNDAQPQRITNRSRIISGYKRLREYQRKARNNSTHTMPTTIIVDETPSTAPVLTNLQIQRMMEPLDTYTELLPTDAPENHPHLVQVWDPALVGLPRERHDHLNLIDTAVSIIYKYDAETRSTIQAFFNTEQVKHFFFLFKSRTNKFHSWSIEREGDIVTIGIERNQRAPNVTTSESPSAGQYDLTLRYQLRQYPSLARTADNEVAGDTLSAYWTPVGTSIFPSQPCITEFLYNTPPNRGADDHETFKTLTPNTTSTHELRSAFQSDQPSATSQIPSDRLSILARYIQNTAFTALAMEADFQVCWGHRVRYDAVLGRVRAAFTNAIKGAATQARKREAGEYNRPVPQGSGSVNTGGEKPGSGAAIGHLRGGSGTDSCNSKAKSAISKKRSASERAMENHVVEDDNLDAEEGGKSGGENTRRKRRARSGRRGSEEISGSEYVDSE